MHDEESLIRLGVIEGKLDSYHQLVDKKLGDHETRLQSTEKSRWTDRGALGILIALIGGFLYKVH